MKINKVIDKEKYFNECDYQDGWFALLACILHRMIPEEAFELYNMKIDGRIQRNSKI